MSEKIPNSEGVKFEPFAEENIEQQAPSPETGAEKASSEPQKQPVKRGRGRPKGSTTKKQQTSKNEPKNEPQPKKQLSIEDELKNLSENYAAPSSEILPPSDGGNNDNSRNEVYISGAILLVLCDVVFPRGITLVFGGNAETRRKMKLTAEEKRELTPLADEAAKELLSGLTPVQQFLIAMGAVYAGKL